MKSTKVKFVTVILLLILLAISIPFASCSNTLKGKYFVSSEYIIACASLTVTETNGNGETTYTIDITHDSDIKLNYIKYKCDLYYNSKVIETFEGEVPMNGLYSRYIPIKTNKEYDHAKVICTGYSDEDPQNFVRLNAMTSAEMKNCEHKNLIGAEIKRVSTNNKEDYMLINYSSTTAYADFRFFYDTYQNIALLNEQVNVCVDCGYFSVK